MDTVNLTRPSHNRAISILRHLSPDQFSSNPALHSSSSSFKYSLDTKPEVLIPEQRSFYEENGFLVIRNLFDKSQTEKYVSQFRSICDGKTSTPIGMQIMKDRLFSEQISSSTHVTKIQGYENDPILFSYCTQKKILDIASSFCGENIAAMHTMVIAKPPDLGKGTSRHPLHQDLIYFPFRPVDKIVASWTALERVTRENGCLSVIPGSHKGELLDHGYPRWDEKANAIYHGIDLNDELLRKKSISFPKRIHLEMDVGDTVFFHPLLIHGSGMNRTTNTRMAISCHFAASDGDYLEEEGGNVEPKMEGIINEAVHIAKKKGVQIRYTDIWKFRARLVKGNPGPLTPHHELHSVAP